MSVKAGDLEISVKCNYVVLFEDQGDVAKGVLVEDLQSDGEHTYAISRFWEFAKPLDALLDVHTLPVTRYFLSRTVLALPLDLFMEEFKIVHQSNLKFIPEPLREPVSTFTHVSDQDGRLRRVAASKIEFGISEVSRARSLGIKLRKAIASKLRKLNATKGKISLSFPFAKEEAWRILKQHCPNIIAQGKSRILTLQDRAQLDDLCGSRWDCHIFGSGAFNIVTSLQLKSCSTENFTLTFRFLKDNTPFDEKSYRLKNPLNM